jgi:phosphatidylglycerol:prolipoprotein diacylglycerol transferase
MFVHNINPVLLNLGPLEIRYYGLVYVFGFVLGYYLLTRYRKKLNLTKEKVDSLVLYIFIGMLAGARIFHFLFSDIQALLSNPLEIFFIWRGGMSFFGGFIGGTTALWLFIRRNNLDYYKIADALVIPVTIALILGRFANFINGEIVGTITSVAWCFRFPGYTGCRHPYQLYASFSHAILLGFLLIGRKVKQKGFLFWLFITGYGGIRLLTDFYRAEPRFLGLTIWQYFSAAAFLIGLYMIHRRLKRKTL